MKTLSIISSSFKMTLAEISTNRLRTFLSLLGIAIGIFCIIGVLAIVESLKTKIKSDLNELGNNTVYVQKWPMGGDENYPWWKYVKRPEPKFSELAPLKAQSNYSANVAFLLIGNNSIEFMDEMLTNVSWYGATDDFNQIQTVNLMAGRYITPNEFANGSPVSVIGYENARKLFDEPSLAVGKVVNIAGRRVTIVGVMKKAGASMVGGWDFDNILIAPFNFCRQVVDENKANRLLLVKGKEGISVQTLKDELKGIMRGIRKLKPTEDDNFALNDVSASGDILNAFFVNVNIGGFVIGGFSLIVGLFGIANIMFVTVKERTSQIGLKKAVGAKRSYILTEFLIESSLLCLMGGLVGLLLIFLLTLILSQVLSFKVFVSIPIVLLSLGISILVGLLAGILPAINASRLDPVVAIQSK